jgi:putative transposase
VDSDVKAGLLDLVDDARQQGFSMRRAARVLEIDPWRVSRWIARRADNRLADLQPGGNPVHGLLDWEVAAILDVSERWAEIDRSHRKLATVARARGPSTSRNRRSTGCFWLTEWSCRNAEKRAGR